MEAYGRRRAGNACAAQIESEGGVGPKRGSASGPESIGAGTGFEAEGGHRSGEGDSDSGCGER